MISKNLFTSESVSAGHPDKLCDQISDCIVDAFLKEDPSSKTAIETVATTNRVHIFGEFYGPSSVIKNIENLARQTVRDIGYEQEGFHWENFEFKNYLHAQSPDINQAVNKPKDEQGAGDQGIMFGYACQETESLMPATLHYAHRILENLNHERTSKLHTILGPDAKSQLTLTYENGIPIEAHTIVLSSQHHPDATQQQLEDKLIPIIEYSLPKGWVTPKTRILINSSGKFVIGGPDGDCGLTGRKIIVDTYGGAAPHGGGAFSGKDSSKVDRSAAYMARYVAKNIVAAGAAKRCTLQVSYALGKSNPLSIHVNLHNTGVMPTEELLEILNTKIDWRPKIIQKTLGLHKPIFQKTASYGHFGRTPEDDGHFSWEKTDIIDLFK